MSLLETDAAFRKAMRSADVVHADGGFLVTASRFLGRSPIKERSATTDLMHDFAARAAAENLSFYLLGGTAAINEGCAKVLLEQYPGLRIVGRRDGYFSTTEESGIVEEISRLKPDVLWVALGKPKEQLFAVRHAAKVRSGWVVTCGGCFNFVVGDYRRAPVWMQKANLEWVHRAISRPRQLMWRYLTTTPHALWIVLTKTRR